MVALFADDVALDAEAKEAIPTEGEMWIKAQRSVDCLVRSLEPGHHRRVQEGCQAGVLQDSPGGRVDDGVEL